MATTTTSTMAALGDVLRLLTALVYTIQSTASIKLPSDLGQELYCVGCEAVTKELHRQLTSRSSESLEVRVEEALEAICDKKYYRGADYSTAKMVRACKYLLEQYDEDMEQILIGHIRSDDNQKALESRICHMLSKACLGLRNAKKQDPRETDEYKNFEIKIDESKAKYARPVAAGSGKKDEL